MAKALRVTKPSPLAYANSQFLAWCAVGMARWVDCCRALAPEARRRPLPGTVGEPVPSATAAQ